MHEQCGSKAAAAVAAAAATVTELTSARHQYGSAPSVWQHGISMAMPCIHHSITLDDLGQTLLRPASNQSDSFTLSSQLSLLSCLGTTASKAGINFQLESLLQKR